MIFQNSDIQLFNTTVAEELAFGPRQLGLPEEEIEKRVNDTLALLEIEHPKGPYSLSPFWRGKETRGDCQCAHDESSVLLFDEPLTASHRNTNVSSRNYYKS